MATPPTSTLRQQSYRRHASNNLDMGHMNRNNIIEQRSNRGAQLPSSELVSPPSVSTKLMYLSFEC